MAAGITVQDLHLFHTIDREIFTRLVINLARDPAQSLLVMALWFCLEEINFPCIINKMVILPDAIVSKVADEAVMLLRCLESQTPPMASEGDMPFSCITMGSNLSLAMFWQHKYSMISGIKSFLNNVCADVFADILLHVVPGNSRACYNRPLTVPGFPHPTFGSIIVVPRKLDFVIPSRDLWGWSPIIAAPEDDRTLFLTFSRGYPVTEIEVTQLFNAYYGNCVEHVRMVPSSSSSSSSHHPLYARMVLHSVSTVDRILSGGPIAKFRVNGKHVWARKYERREHHDRA